MSARGDDEGIVELLGRLFQAHPWHGVAPGPDFPDRIVAYVEITPQDTVKYEIDKASGHLAVDRPQRFSSVCPTLYGFVPQSYAGPRVARLCTDATGLSGIAGDGDPIDICILSERPFLHGGFLVNARPIGGFRMVDGREADDKVIAVLDDDVAFGKARGLEDVPPMLLERLRHYFLSYKQLPGESPEVSIPETYDREAALEVLRAADADYRALFGDPALRASKLRGLISQG